MVQLSQHTAREDSREECEKDTRGQLRFEIALPIAFALIVILYLLASPYSIADSVGSALDSDYGVLTHTHLRVMQGETLYSDIRVGYPPGASCLIVPLYKIFGDNLQTLRITLAFVGAFASFLGFLFALKLTSFRYAVGVAALIFLAGPICINYPYPNWFCMSLGLFMIVLERIAWKKQSNLCHLVAGATAGLIFSLKQNWGAFAFVALLCIILFGEALKSGDQQQSSKRVRKLDFLAYPLLFALPILSLILLRENLTPLNVVVFSLPAFATGAVGLTLLNSSKNDDSSVIFPLVPMVYATLAFSAITFSWIIYFLVKLGLEGFYQGLIHPLIIHGSLDYPPLAKPGLEALCLILLFCFQGILILKRDISNRFKSAYLIMLCGFGVFLLLRMTPFIIDGLVATDPGKYSNWGSGITLYAPLAIHLGFAFVLLRDFRDSEMTSPEQLYLTLVLWLYSVAVFHVFYPVMELYHFICTLPPVIILGGVFIFRSLKYWKNEIQDGNSFILLKPSRLCLGLIVPALFFLFFGLPAISFFLKIETSPFKARLAEFSDIDSPRGGALMPQERANSISSVVRYVRANTRPNEYIFDMSGSFFYFLTDRKNPTAWVAMYPSFLSTQDIGDIRERLDALEPPLVINSPGAEWKFSRFYPDLHSYIYSRYRRVETYGEYSVFALNRRSGTGNSGQRK